MLLYLFCCHTHHLYKKSIVKEGISNVQSFSYFHCAHVKCFAFTMSILKRLWTEQNHLEFTFIVMLPFDKHMAITSNSAASAMELGPTGSP